MPLLVGCDFGRLAVPWLAVIAGAALQVRLLGAMGTTTTTTTITTTTTRTTTTTTTTTTSATTTSATTTTTTTTTTSATTTTTTTRWDCTSHVSGRSCAVLRNAVARKDRLEIMTCNRVLHRSPLHL